MLTNQAVAGPGFMGTPEAHGVNTDVVLILLQLAQVGYPSAGAGPKTIRLFSGRLHTRSPLMFFGHGAGNDNNQNLSFTFTKE